MSEATENTVIAALQVLADQVDEPVVSWASDAEQTYLNASRAENTFRGYASDWREFASWCQAHDLEPAPAEPATIRAYLSDLARAGAKVGTMSRRLSALRFGHRVRNQPDPTRDATVQTVWEGIRRLHGAPVEQSDPLMPPELNRVIANRPTIRSWKGPRPDEPHLAGLRDRAVISVGFFAALRRSELAGLDVEDLERHDRGYVLHIKRSKTNQTGMTDELAVLPYAHDQLLCPVTNLDTWLQASSITEGPVFRSVSQHNKLGSRLTGNAINQDIVHKAVQRAGITTGHYSAHSLRAGFITYANLKGASDRAIAHQSRHRSLDTLTQYIRISDAWTNNAVTLLGL